jgi:hypothetical protein
LLAYREGRRWRDVRSDDINDYLKEHLGDDVSVLDRYLSGWTIAGALERIPSFDVVDDRVRTQVERAVVDLLKSNTESAALEPVAA